MANAPFGSQLFVFNKNLHKYINDMVLEFDLNYIQMLFLIKINVYPNITQKELAEFFFLTKGYVAKAIKDLENKNFIERVRNPNDKRKYDVKLTEKSQELIPVFENINRKWEKKMGLDKVDSSFFRTFNELTDKSIRIMEDEK